MIDTGHHLDWSTLNDFADGTLSSDVAAEVEQHLSSCAQCREELDTLRATIGTLESAAVAPVPEALWADIQQSISATAKPTSNTHSRFRSYNVSAPKLAAAAVLLVVSSVSATLLFSRMDDAPSQLASTDSVTMGSTPTMQLTATDARFIPGVEALEKQLASQRSTLRPETVVILEKSLNTIDDALIEARMALLADPANAALRQVLETTYRQKLEFLTRATRYAVGE